MDLLDLPPELFEAIITETVFLVGLRPAVKLRLVSKLFDAQVQRAIYALPSFDNNYSWGRLEFPERISLPSRMHPTMTTRLILSKMNSKLSLQRPLCLAINRAVTYLEDKYHHDSREKFELVEALAGAAARNLSLVEISECLVTDPVRLLEEIDKVRAGDRWEGRHLLQSKRPLHNYSIQYLTPSSESYIDSAPQDALIIAIVTGRFELAKQLLNDGVSVRNKSPAFGIPLEAAAAMGAIEAVQFMLKTLETGPEGSGRGLTGPIMSAVENRHADIAMFLLEHRRPIPPSAEEDPNWFLGSREERFWRALASTFPVSKETAAARHFKDR